jgi:tetratricopeptide (TPR) repeat protein
LETLEPELSYLFKHIITQQVAYDTLLFSQRRDLHRTVANWYERVYADSLSPYYALLVHHWNRAEDVARERRYARLAGEQAAAQYANAEAVTHLSRALNLIPQDDAPEWGAERYALLLSREKVYALQGAREARSRDLAALEELAAALDDGGAQAVKRRVALALRHISYAEMTSDYPAMIEATRVAAQWALKAGDKAAQAMAYAERGWVSWAQQDYAAAREHCERALTLAQASDDPGSKAECLRRLGLVYGGVKQSLAALGCFQQALVIWQALGNREREATCLNDLATACNDLGRLAETRDYYEQSLAIKRAIGDRRGEIVVLYNLSLVHRSQGEGEIARRYCEEVLATSRAIGDRRLEAYALTYLGLILEKLHTPESASKADLDASRAYYAQALDIRREIGQPALCIDCLAGLARVALTQGRMTEALERVDEALSWMAAHGIAGIGDVMLAYQTAHRVLWAAGQEARARAALGAAYDLLMEWVQGLDGAARRAMLEDVWPHAEIIAAYQAMQATGE